MGMMASGDGRSDGGNKSHGSGGCGDGKVMVGVEVSVMVVVKVTVMGNFLTRKTWPAVAVEASQSAQLMF
jgi:hypothetical protein